jgi:hypothetical protein
VSTPNTDRDLDTPGFIPGLPELGDDSSKLSKGFAPDDTRRDNVFLELDGPIPLGIWDMGRSCKLAGSINVLERLIGPRAIIDGRSSPVNTLNKMFV